MLSDLRFRLRALLRRKQVERELDDELRFHLERLTDRHVKAGLAPAEAARRARLELGGLDEVKEECRDARGVGLIDGLVQDLRYGARTLRKLPGFTAVAVLTLALGIGANTAMFSVVNGVLLHPLPFPDAQEIVRLHASKPSFARGSISYPNFRDWHRMSRTFAAMAISRSTSYTVTGTGDADRLNGEQVSADFFAVLGAKPLIGRTFAPGEDERGAAPLAVIGEGLWARRYASSPEVLGRTIVLDGKSYTIIGAVPQRLDLRAAFGLPARDVYVPIGQWDWPALEVRAAGLGIHGLGRLAPGVTVAQAQADLDAVTRTLAATYPEVNKDVGAAVVPMEESLVGSIRPLLLLLLGAVGFVLLIACVNVANLLLARSAARARELAVRRALGASVGRLLRQLLTESVLLSLAGGAVGLCAAVLGTRALLGALPSTALPRAGEVGLDLRVLVFTLAISLLSALLFGVLPAVRAARPSVPDALRDGGRGTTGGRHRAQGVFVIAQTAMTLVLLVGAGLMVRTLAGLLAVDPGFRPHGVLTFGLALSPATSAAGPDAVRAELRAIEGALAGTPGVEAASLSWSSIPMGGSDDGAVWPAGRPGPDGQIATTGAVRYVVGPGYLETMGIPLLRGRFLRPTDDERAPLVVVVDEVLAKALYPGEDAVGKQLHVDDFGDDTAEVVGVVGHVKQWGMDRDDRSAVRGQVVQSLLQSAGGMLVRATKGAAVVRVRGHAPALLEALRSAVRRVNRDHVVFDARTMDEVVASSLAPRRFSMLVLATFAALALLMSCVGIYGVVSFVVSRRTNEIGIRMALGAQRRDVLLLVLRGGLRLTLAGVVLGLLAAAAVTRLMDDLVYGVAPTDPVTFFAVAAGLLVVALAASLLPARRAARVDPMQALRLE